MIIENLLVACLVMGLLILALLLYTIWLHYKIINLENFIYWTNDRITLLRENLAGGK